MKSSRSTFVDALGCTVAVRALSFAILFFASLIGLLIFWIANKTEMETFRVVGTVWFLLGLAASIFTSREIVTRMHDDELSFMEAVAHTWYHYLLCFSFIPLFGPFIGRFIEKKKQNPFTINDGSSENKESNQ